MDGNFTVISNEEAQLLEKLKTMYFEVCQLTLNHDVLNDTAVVYPRYLGPVLEKIDRKWYMNVL